MPRLAGTKIRFSLNSIDCVVMSEIGSNGSDKFPLREFIGDFFCWIVFPIVGLMLFIVGGLIIQFFVLQNSLYIGLLVILSVPTTLSLAMWIFMVLRERGREYHIPLILLGQVLMIIGAFGPVSGFTISGSPTMLLQIGSWVMLLSVIPNFLGLIAWLNLVCMRTFVRQ